MEDHTEVTSTAASPSITMCATGMALGASCEGTAAAANRPLVERKTSMRFVGGALAASATPWELWPVAVGGIAHHRGAVGNGWRMLRGYLP